MRKIKNIKNNIFEYGTKLNIEDAVGGKRLIKNTCPAVILSKARLTLESNASEILIWTLITSPIVTSRLVEVGEFWWVPPKFLAGFKPHTFFALLGGVNLCKDEDPDDDE